MRSYNPNNFEQRRDVAENFLQVLAKYNFEPIDPELCEILPRIQCVGGVSDELIFVRSFSEQGNVIVFTAIVDQQWKGNPRGFPEIAHPERAKRLSRFRKLRTFQHTFAVIEAREPSGAHVCTPRSVFATTKGTVIGITERFERRLLEMIEMIDSFQA